MESSLSFFFVAIYRYIHYIGVVDKINRGEKFASSITVEFEFQYFRCFFY